MHALLHDHQGRLCITFHRRLPILLYLAPRVYFSFSPRQDMRHGGHGGADTLSDLVGVKRYACKAWSYQEEVNAADGSGGRHEFESSLCLGDCLYCSASLFITECMGRNRRYELASRRTAGRHCSTPATGPRAQLATRRGTCDRVCVNVVAAEQRLLACRAYMSHP